MAIAYAYDGTIYLAVTRRCTLACTFCPKTHGRWVVAGNDMSRDQEPTLDALLLAARELSRATGLRQVAFVGLGEPTMRLDLVVGAGQALREEGHSVRVVTDGLANLRTGRDVTTELIGAVDEVHVSLNAPDAETYARLCPNRHRAAAHAAVCDFLRALRGRPVKVVASVVAASGVDLAACQTLATRLGVPLRVRPYFDPPTGEPHQSPP